MKTISVVALVAAAGFAGAASQGPTLRTLVPKGMLIGAAVGHRVVAGGAPVAADIVAQQFNSVTAENVLKWERVHPEPERFDFAPADAFVAFGERHGLAIIGHTLVWHQQTPAWVFTSPDGQPLGREALLARMRAHIHAVAGRYKGRVRGWDVVNEAIDEDGSLRKSNWLEIAGEEFIARAFEYAREADPAAELYYNDYNLWKPAKRKGVLALVQRLRGRGLRVDAIGEQGHYGLDTPAIGDIDAAITELAASGLPVLVTELDVDVLPRRADMWGADLSKQQAIRAETNVYPDGLPADQQRALANRYAEIFRTVMKHRAHVARVTFWGVTDAESWLNNFPVRGRVNHPLLWDRKGAPKEAFAAVVKTLQP